MFLDKQGYFFGRIVILALLSASCLFISSACAAVPVVEAVESIPYEEQAQVVLKSIRNGDFDAVSALFNEYLEKRLKTRHGVYSASSLINRLFDPEAIELEELRENILPQLELWTQKKPQSATAYAVSGTYHFRAAWRIRGHKYAEKTSSAVWDPFKKQIELAEQQLRKAISLEPANFLAYSYLIDTLRSKGGDDAAANDIFEKGLKIVPWSMPLLQARAYFLDPRWGGSKEAKFAFIRKLLASAPADTPVSFILADALVEDCCMDSSTKVSCLNNPQVWEEIESSIRPLIVKFPQSGFYAQFLASSANKAKRWDIAGEFYPIAAERELNNPHIQYMAGWYFDNKAKTADSGEKALKYYSRAIQLNPKKSEAYFGQGKIYTLKKDLGRALAAFSKAIELDPEDADAYARRAYVYMMMGQANKGVEDCRAALKLKPDHDYANKLLKDAGAGL